MYFNLIELEQLYVRLGIEEVIDEILVNQVELPCIWWKDLYRVVPQVDSFLAFLKNVVRAGLGLYFQSSDLQALVRPPVILRSDAGS